MYLFPLGYGTIAADRRAEERRIEEEEYARIRWELAQEKIREEDRRHKKKATEAFLEKERRRLDPGHHEDNPLSETAQKILDELRREKNSFGNYREILDDGKFNARVRQDVARAMAVSEIHFGLLDPISSNLTYEIFDRFTGGPGLPKFQVSGRSYSWKELKQVYIGNYSNPGRQRLSEEPDPTSRMDLAIDCGSLSLKVSVLKEGGVRWSLRGASLLKLGHRRVLTELNGVLEDYELRLKWLTEYRAGSFVPGYGVEDVRSAQNSISHFNESVRPRMDWLKPGVFILGEYTLVSMNETRIYPVRCTSCERVARTESFWPQGFTKVNWKEGRGIFHASSVESPLNRVVSSLHAKTGCGGEYGINARNGERTAI